MTYRDTHDLEFASLDDRPKDVHEENRRLRAECERLRTEDWKAVANKHLDRALVAENDLRALREECERLRTELARVNDEALDHLVACGQARAERDVALARAEQAEQERDQARKIMDIHGLLARAEQAEKALCVHLGCTMEELTASFELGDSKEEMAGDGDCLARIDTLSDEKLAAEAAQAMAERPQQSGGD